MAKQNLQRKRKHESWARRIISSSLPEVTEMAIRKALSSVGIKIASIYNEDDELRIRLYVSELVIKRDNYKIDDPSLIFCRIKVTFTYAKVHLSFQDFSAFYFSAVVESENQNSIVPDGDPVNCCQPKAVIKLGYRLVPLCKINEKAFNYSSLRFLGFAFGGKLIIAPLGLFVPLHIAVVPCCVFLLILRCGSVLLNTLSGQLRYDGKFTDQLIHLGFNCCGIR